MIDAIYERRSTRSYIKKPLSESEKKRVLKYVEETQQMKGPFGNQAAMFFHPHPYFIDDEAKKIGTYGFIANPPAFVGGAIKNTEEAIVDYGFLLEHLIIRLTKEGFDTVWLGGTFNRSAFAHYAQNDTIFPAVTPVGHATEKTTVKDRMIRYAIKADRRKPMEEMFFIKDKAHPIHESDDHPLMDYLKLVRVGPSASNKQPWRLFIDGQKVHFYLEKTPNYGLKHPFAMQLLDMGIAIYHFTCGLNEDKHAYQYQILDHLTFEGMDYILSVVLA